MLEQERFPLQRYKTYMIESSNLSKQELIIGNRTELTIAQILHDGAVAHDALISSPQHCSLRSDSINVMHGT